MEKVIGLREHPKLALGECVGTPPPPPPPLPPSPLQYSLSYITKFTNY